jgi:VCBS repeat-containing protein
MQRTQPVVLVGVDQVEREVHVDVSDGRRCDSMLSLYQDSARVRCVVKGSVTGTDKDKDALTYVGPIGPTAKGGTVDVDANGKFTYTPSAQARHAAATVDPAAKIDTFTITVDDGHGGIVPVSVTVKISPTNTKLDGAAVALGKPNADGALVGTVTANDADNDPFTITGPTSTAKGAISYEAALTCSPTPPPPLPASRRRHPTPARRSGPTPSPSPSTTDTAAPPSCPSNSPSPRSMATSTQAHPTPPRERSPQRSPPGTPTETR